MPTDRDLFQSVLDIADPSHRAAYLSANAPDPVQRGRVERLLAAHAAAGGFLEQAPEAGNLTRGGSFEGATASFAEGDPSATADFPGKDEHIGAILAGKYKLIEAIGEGGMGSVYMALQTEPVKRAVAVKVIKAGMDSKAVLARFEAERQALALMDHPNIAKVLDAGTTESGRPFFVMELVKGMPITEYCYERKLTPRQRLELFVPVCNAIQHAHMKGIIHRDIKPSNVLVAMYDDKPVPKVIDFGVAKAAGQSLTDKTLMTGFGAVVGTPEYMSPEQANLNNLDIDTRSDVYSLGVLLYELLTGSTPVDRKSLGKAAILEILRIVREVEAPKPSHKLSSSETLPSVAACRGTEPAKLSKLMRGELDWVVLKELEKDRTRRYDTANGLARDIQRYLADEIVEARPASASYRLRKLIRRHKGRVIAAGLVLLVLFAGMAGTTLGLIRADRARADEAEQRRIAEDNETAAKESEGRAVLASERAKASEAGARTALDSADKILGIQEGLRATGGYSPDQLDTLQGLAGQFEAVAKLGTGADSAEAYNRLARVQVLLEKPSERDQSLARSVQMWIELVRTDPANANEHRIQLAKTRARQLATVPYKNPPDPVQVALTRHVAADWKAATDANPTNAMAFSERATILQALAHIVCPGVPYPQSPPPEQLAEKAAVDREALACMSQAVELRPDDQAMWQKLLRLHGDSNASPEAIRTGLRAAARYPDQVIPHGFSPVRDHVYPYARDRATYDSDVCERLMSTRLDPVLGEWKANPTWTPDEAFRRTIADPCRELLKEFPNYKYRMGIEFLLVLREGQMAKWFPWIPKKPDEKPTTPTAEQRRRAADVHRRAIELSRKPETKLPAEFLTLSLRDKGDLFNGIRPKQNVTPITPEEYVWFQALGGYGSVPKDVLAELQRELAARPDWQPTPMFLHRILVATLPDDVLYDAKISNEKLIPLWTQADALFSRIQSGVPRDSEDYRKVAERFSVVAISVANRFQNSGDRSQAKSAYTRCIQLLEENPVQPHNDDSRYRARCYFDRGNLNLDSGDWAAALADYQTALAVSKKKPGEFDNMSTWGLEPISHFRSGTALMRLRKFDEAEKAFDECLRYRREEKYQTRPLKSGQRSIPWVVAVTEHDRAKEYRRIDRWEPAVKWAKLALKTLDENEEVYPLDQVIRLRYSLHAIAAVGLDHLKEFEAAVKQWDSAKKYANAELLRLFAVESASAYARVGRHDEAIRRLDELAKADKITDLEYYNLGCAYAQCTLGTKVEKALAGQLCDRATAMLAKAFQAGMRNYDHAKQDADLDPLRDREDFKKWLEDMCPKPAALPTAIGPDQAAASIGKPVVLEMVVRSVGFSKVEDWMYLNSTEDFKDPSNVAIAIRNPTAELRKAMKLDGDKEKVVGLRVRTTGTIILHRDAPQLVIDRAEQLTVLPKK